MQEGIGRKKAPKNIKINAVRDDNKDPHEVDVEQDLFSYFFIWNNFPPLEAGRSSALLHRVRHTE
jgi:hypothetical protein